MAGIREWAVSLVLLCSAYKLIRCFAFRVLEWKMGKWKCLWCSKVLEGESFMDLIAASEKEEAWQHVHGWENITLAEEEAVIPESKLIPV
jgi:hypothetical protein